MPPAFRADLSATPKRHAASTPKFRRSRSMCSFDTTRSNGTRLSIPTPFRKRFSPVKNLSRSRELGPGRSPAREDVGPGLDELRAADTALAEGVRAARAACVGGAVAGGEGIIDRAAEALAHVRHGGRV